MNRLTTHKHIESDYLPACKATGSPGLKWRVAIRDTRKPSSAFCHLSSAFCPLRSTTVENPLQIHPFLCKTNPILKSHPAINVDIKKHYENISNWTLGENEPKTNPIYRGAAPGQAGTKPIFVPLAVFIAYNRRRMLAIE
jgi:hypothetical protein